MSHIHREDIKSESDMIEYLEAVISDLRDKVSQLKNAIAIKDPESPLLEIDEWEEI